MYKNLYLKKGKEESLKRFHPWIFSGAVAQIEEGVEEGEIVRVFTSQGDFIAVGMYQIGSIAVRVLSFRDVEIDGEFWLSRLQSAWQMRQAIGLIGRENNNTFRLVHGEGDNLPGLVIDCYGDTAVMQAHSVGMHLVRHEICEALVKASEGEIKNVYYKSETTLPFKADVEHENGFIYGSMGSDVAMENGLNFHIDWLKGQKTGFFVDQRENRHLLETYSKGRSVLNMFCYTGGFSVYAMRGGAKLVHSVDSSAKAIELTNRNIELNFPALKGYTRLNVKGLQRIKPGGILFTFSCSQIVTKENFRNAVFTAAVQANRKVRILHQIHQPADHPINIYHPEGEYLKGLVLYVE